MAQSPLCFVLMPFGRKSAPGGGEIEFDEIYRTLLEPAIRDAGLQPLRADQEAVGGFIHRPMFERLILCDYAVADLTSANPNVFYELGIRHAVRPYSTVLVFADGHRLPFDLGPIRALPYQLGDNGRPVAPAADAARLTDALRRVRTPTTDSPVFQLVEGFRPPEVAHLKTDVFRDRAAYSERLKGELAQARREGKDAVARIEESLGPLADTEAGILVDLLLSYRAVEGWDAMIALVDRMPEPLQRVVLVREQLAFALNRASRGEEAEKVLLRILDEHGPSSETYGLLGRVYKDRWEKAREDGEPDLARGFLEQATEAYRKGFEADWRDAYPGINAATLMELAEPPDPARQELLPVVVYSALRRAEARGGDYWDWATLVEARVLADDEAGAGKALAKALARVREPWEPETTARNLHLIREARESRGNRQSWILRIEQALARSGSPKGSK